jgi:hypothetical protein
MTFDFPDRVRVACEQYLLYFVEFLRDIGITAAAELQEEAGQVHFTVTPQGKDEALGNMGEALDIYLRPPMNRNTTVVISPETSMEVQKLSAQLGHFQNQLILANAALHQQEPTQQQVVSGQVLIQALQTEVKKHDAVSLGTDIVKVRPLTWDAVPFEVDLPEVLRRLKEKFGHKKLP